MELTRSVVIVDFPGCDPLGVAAPLQTFSDANISGARYAITVATSDYLPLVGQGGLVVVPGFANDAQPPATLIQWLRASVANGAQACGISTGAFVLGEAGLLDGRSCTTHWKHLLGLETRFPTARVLRDRLFVTDGPITTSAGVASRIDVALWCVLLDYRTHGHPGVHRVQDYLIANVDRKTRIPELAAIAQMGTRTLTRAFRLSTGLSIAEYRSKLRLEAARHLLKDPRTTVSRVAETVGFNDARQLRRVWKNAFGVTPSHSRSQL